MANWKLNWRIVSIVVVVLAAVVTFTIQQHTTAVQAGLPSPISWEWAFWLPIIAFGLNLIATFLPSPFGQSAEAPPGTSERKVLQMATREAVVDVLSDPGHPIRRELDRDAVKA